MAKTIRCAIYTRKSTEEGLKENLAKHTLNRKPMRGGRLFKNSTMMADIQAAQ